MNEVEVEVVEAQVFERFATGSFNVRWMMEGIPKLGSYEEVRPGYACFKKACSYPFTNLDFVTVITSRVNVTPVVNDSVFNNLSSIGPELPTSKADRRHVLAGGVEGYVRDGGGEGGGGWTRCCGGGCGGGWSWHAEGGDWGGEEDKEEEEGKHIAFMCGLGVGGGGLGLGLGQGEVWRTRGDFAAVWG